MDMTRYSYKNKSYRPCPTVPDKNSFFHSTFGARTDGSGEYFDKQAKFRRMRLAAFLTYFENEDTPSSLADILTKCFSANGKYSRVSLDDKQNLAEYISDIIGGEQDVTKEEIPLLATLEDIKVVIISNGKVSVIEPNPNIFGSYPKEVHKEKPKEIVICLEDNTFARLEPVDEGCSSKPHQKKINKKTDPSKYRKGGSAGSKGVEYQISLLAMVILNSMKTNRNGWKLSTENEDAGKFDDIVLEWSGGATLIQSKHKEDNKKKISLEELLSTNSKNDDFSLPKYFLSYVSIKEKFNVENVIICTNAGIHEDALNFFNRQQADAHRSLLNYEGGNCFFYTLNDNILPFLKEKSIGYYWRNFRNKGIEESIITDENLNDFLERLQLYFNYPPLKNLEKLIEKSLSLIKYCNDSQGKITAMEMYSKVTEWFQKKEGVYFAELHAKALFAEIWADKYCQRLEHYKVSLQKNNLHFQGSRQVFQVVAKGKGLLEVIKVYLSLIDHKANVLFLHHEDDFSAQKQVVEAFSFSKYVFLVIVWPVTIEEDAVHEICDKLKSMLEQHQYKRVILIAKDNTFTGEIGFKDTVQIDASMSFQDLSSVTQETLIKENNIMFQGKSVSLEELLPEKSADYGIVINSEMLEKFMRRDEIVVGSLLLGLDQQTQRYYMKRTFSRKFTKINEVVDTRTHQNQIVEGSIDEKVDELLCEETFPEDSIFHLDEKLIVISDGAGMGKSTVLVKLASTIKQRQPDLWVVRITLNDYTRVLGDCLANGRDIVSIRELLDSRNKTKLTNHLEQCIFFTHQKVVLMLDAIDEISPDYTRIVLNMIKQCEKESNFIKIIITTRPHVTNDLETELNVKPFILEPFTEENQIDFLTNYWAHNLKLEDESSKEKCKRYAKQLIHNISWTSLTNNADDNFVSIPLHVKMAAEIFQDDIGEETEPNLLKISVTELYELFFDKKWDIFYKKENPDRKTWTNQELAKCFDQYRAYHRNLAIEVIVDRDNSSCLSCYQPNDKHMETNLLKIGIVQKVNDTFSFIHRTFADYFLAEVLLIELQQNQSLDFQTFLIDTIFLTVQYNVTRIFLDSLLKKVVDTLPANIFETYQSARQHNTAKSYKLLHILAEEGSIVIMRLIFKCINVQICKSGINMTRNDETDSDDWKNTLSVMQYFIRNHGINIQDKKGQTPLHRAAERGRTDVIKFLTAQETNVDAEDITTNPSGELGVENTVDLPTDVKMKDKSRRTVLHLAANSGRLDTVKFLVKYGLDLHDGDDLGRTPLHLASCNGHLHTVEYLLEAGTHRDVRNHSLNTPLHSAATFGQLEVVKFLIEAGSDVNGKGFRDRTTLHLASANGNLETVKFLLDRGADPTLRDNEGYTAIHVAASCGRLNTLKFFVEYGLDFNVTNAHQQTLLHSAAANGHLETVKYLLEIGVDREIRNNSLNTALHSAASLGQQDVVKFLVETGSDVNRKGFRGRTPLHLATVTEKLETVKVLLEQGADPRLKDDDGRTVINMAASSDRLYFITFFVQYGLFKDTNHP